MLGSLFVASKNNGDNKAAPVSPQQKSSVTGNPQQKTDRPPPSVPPVPVLPPDVVTALNPVSNVNQDLVQKSVLDQFGNRFEPQSEKWRIRSGMRAGKGN